MRSIECIVGANLKYSYRRPSRVSDSSIHCRYLRGRSRAIRLRHLWTHLFCFYDIVNDKNYVTFDVYTMTLRNHVGRCKKRKTDG